MKVHWMESGDGWDFFRGQGGVILKGTESPFGVRLSVERCRERWSKVDLKEPYGRQDITQSSFAAVAISGVPNMMIEFYFQSYKYVNFTTQRGTVPGSACNNGIRSVVTQF
jgi:hypothetical protein